MMMTGSTRKKAQVFAMLAACGLFVFGLQVAYIFGVSRSNSDIERLVEAACDTNPNDVRFTLSSSVGDDWFIYYADGAVDTTGNEAAATHNKLASTLYDQDEVESVQSVAARVLEDHQPATLRTVVNDTQIETKIVPIDLPILEDVVGFCTKIEGGS